jgi:Holliday junction resolvase RusA-like endonuclease
MVLVLPRNLRSNGSPPVGIPERKDEVSFVFEGLPPSLNDQYIKFRRQGGKRGVALSEEAKAFEKQVRSVVGSQVFQLQGFPTGDKEVMYELEIHLYFEQLENPGWFDTYVRGEHAGERKAQSRFKKLDVDNRVKFLQDRLCAAIGIPGDEQIFHGGDPWKHQSKHSRTEVTLRVLNDRKKFFPEEP